MNNKFIELIDKKNLNLVNNRNLIIVKDGKFLIGLFKKIGKNIRLVSKNPILINIEKLPISIVKNKNMIIKLMLFKYRKNIRRAVWEIKYENRRLLHNFYFFDKDNFFKVFDYTIFDNILEEELKSIMNKNPINLKLKTTISLVQALVPEKILKLILKTGVTYLIVNENISYLPLELLHSRFPILLKRKLSTTPFRSTKRKSVKKFSLLGNGWDNRFRFIKEEIKFIFELLKNKGFEVDLWLSKIKLQELLEIVQNSDFLYISSHAEFSSFDIVSMFTNESFLKNLSQLPKVVFFNTCYFEGLENIAKSFIENGCEIFLAPYMKIPDSSQTFEFVTNFFNVFTQTMDIDTTFFISKELSKKRGHYNHLLYRLFS